MLIALMVGCRVPEEDAGGGQAADYCDLDTGTSVVSETGRWLDESLSVQSARCQKLRGDPAVCCGWQLQG
ncbi:MAG: hypothetical protein ACI8RZ_000618 [Myxococcota bacterium]|jgi:hypothetical protein